MENTIPGERQSAFIVEQVDDGQIKFLAFQEGPVLQQLKEEGQAQNPEMYFVRTHVCFLKPGLK